MSPSRHFVSRKTASYLLGRYLGSKLSIFRHRTPRHRWHVGLQAIYSFPSFSTPRFPCFHQLRFNVMLPFHFLDRSWSHNFTIAFSFYFTHIIKNNWILHLACTFRLRTVILSCRQHSICFILPISYSDFF